MTIQSMQPARRDPTALQHQVSESKLTWLGEPLGDYQYGTLSGREYAVQVRAAEPGSFSPQPGEILVTRRTRELIDGSPFESAAYHRGFLVKPGTYAEMAAKAHKPVAEKPMRSWDTLASLPVMRRREPVRIAAGLPASKLDVLEQLPAQSEHERDAIGAAVDLLDRNRPPAVIEVGGHEPPQPSPAGIVAYLADRGVELQLQRGRLVARSRNPLRHDDRELIERAEELLTAHLAGRSVLCSMCSEPATTVVFPRAPMCAAHAGP